MFNAIKSECRKLISLRSTWVNLILLLGSISGVTLLILTFSDAKKVEFDWQLLLQGASIFLIIAIIAAANGTSGEISRGMHAHAFITQPRRSHWLTARYLVTFAYLTLAFAGSVGLSILMVVVAPRGEFGFSNESSLITSLLQLVVFVLLALGLGALSGNRAVAITLPLTWVLIIEPLLLVATTFLESLHWLRFLMPMNRINDIGLLLTVDNNLSTQIGFEPRQILPLWANLLILVVWVGVFTALAFIRNQRRDVKQ